MRAIEFEVTTKSNLMIGGIDQCTVIDHNGKPYIPGSSFKGAFRKIIKANESDNINKIYIRYLEKTFAKIKNTKIPISDESVTKYFKECKVKASAEYLFGLEGFNQAPRLLFSDLYFLRSNHSEGLFSIDAKNAIMENNGELQANPRVYKVARSGLVFKGVIQFYNFQEFKEEDCEVIETYLKDNLCVFNEGIARLGNSKSRGYGKIKVEIGGEKGASL